jgi:hypothetical protein
MQQQPPPPQPRTGFGITALVVRLIAICLGLIPLLGLGAITGGIVTVTFGLLGIGRAAEVSQARRRCPSPASLRAYLLVRSASGASEDVPSFMELRRRPGDHQAPGNGLSIVGSCGGLGDLLQRVAQRSQVHVAVDAPELLASLNHPGGAPAQRHLFPQANPDGRPTGPTVPPCSTRAPSDVDRRPDGPAGRVGGRALPLGIRGGA